MFCKRIFLVLFLLAVNSLTICSSHADDLQDSDSRLVLQRTVELDFQPQSSIFFLFSMDTGNPTVIEGSVIESHSSDAGNQRSWLVAASVRIPDNVESLSYAALVRGQGREVAYLQPTTVEVGESRSETVDALRAQVLEKQKAVKEWERQIQAQASTLKRLGADADTIARVSRVGEVKQEIKKMQQELALVDVDIARLRSFLKSVARTSAPKNFVRREVELINQLKTLAEKTSKAEAQEGQRLSRAQLDLEQGMQVVEATRYDDLQKLQDEFQRLQKYRLQLESEIPVSG